jgi:primosomal protein N'
LRKRSHEKGNPAATSGGGAFPSIEVVDMRGEKTTISARLAEALRATKAEGRQSILF